MTVDRYPSDAYPTWSAVEFSASITEPLIGSDEFAARAFVRCKDFALLAGTATAEGRRDRLLRAVAIMVGKPFAEHKVADLAAVAGMSRSTFAECFVAVFDLPPMNFLKQERLRVAAHLLWTSPLSVKVVAGRIGYESASYFSRSFRDEFGVSPNEVAKLGAADRLAAPGGGRSSVSADMWREIAERTTLARDRLQLICDATHDVIWDIDLRTGLLWWGEGMSRVFGYEPDQIGPDTSWCHEHIHPEDRARVTAGMKAACDNGDSLWRDEFRYRKANDTYANVLDRGAVLRDSHGQAIRFVGAMNELAS